MRYLYAIINEENRFVRFLDSQKAINAPDHIRLFKTSDGAITIPPMGSIWDGERWIEETVITEVTTMSKYAFRQRLKMEEQMLLDNPDQLSELLTVMGLDVGEISLFDQALLKTFAKNLEIAQTIDLNDNSLKMGIEHLVQKGILTAERAAEILSPATEAEQQREQAV